MLPSSLQRPTLCAIACVLLAACSVLPTLQRRPRTPDERARETVLHAVLQAERESADQADYVFDVRHNPPDCACPPHEVRIGNRWTRAELRNPETRQPVVPTPTPPTALQRMRLRPTHQVALDTNGWRYPVLELLEVLDDGTTATR